MRTRRELSVSWRTWASFRSKLKFYLFCHQTILFHKSYLVIHTADVTHYASYTKPLPRALDATQQDAGHKKWVGLIQQLAQEITVSIEAMVNKNPAEWEKDGKMPEGCELSLSTSSSTTAEGMSNAGIVAQAMVGDVFETVRMVPWRIKMVGVLERALFRTLRRQPVVRVDM